jgi:hypothetical protein
MRDALQSKNSHLVGNAQRPNVQMPQIVRDLSQLGSDALDSGEDVVVHLFDPNGGGKGAATVRVHGRENETGAAIGCAQNTSERALPTFVSYLFLFAYVATPGTASRRARIASSTCGERGVPWWANFASPTLAPIANFAASGA